MCILSLIYVMLEFFKKHQTKAYNKKCACCKLTFSSKEDVAKHSKDHASNYRGIIHGKMDIAFYSIVIKFCTLFFSVCWSNFVINIP